MISKIVSTNKHSRIKSHSFSCTFKELGFGAKINFHTFGTCYTRITREIVAIEYLSLDVLIQMN